ncbi:MAG: DUF3479 domain-containing protein [Comamonadaceae bacterium]|nr:DUF3479 domain-containing protein [Comamonadaceae bacterium]
MHAAAEWGDEPDGAAALHRRHRPGRHRHRHHALHGRALPAVLPALQARREHCDAMVCAMSAGEVSQAHAHGQVRHERAHQRPDGAAQAAARQARRQQERRPQGAGEKQMAMLRRLPKLLRFIPGTAQDVRVYFLALQYWLAGSRGQRRRHGAPAGRPLRRRRPRGAARRARSRPAPVRVPRARASTTRACRSASSKTSPRCRAVATDGKSGTVGLLLLRSLPAGRQQRRTTTASSRRWRRAGLRVIPAFATGLDARPAVERFFIERRPRRRSTRWSR